MTIMISFCAVALLILQTFAAKQRTWQNAPSGPPPGASSGPPIPRDKDGKYTIVSEGIRIQFIPYGASVTNLFINDTNGIERDIILGYDDATTYATDKSHPHLGGVPGRYANRIKNSSFVLDGQRYKVPANENNGANTLHGGPNGWDYREFEVVEHSRDHIIFKLTDPDGSQGFPGEVVAYIYYKVIPYRWQIYMNATSSKVTPIMLTSHAYWNLDGFQNPNTQTVMNHNLYLPFSGQRIDVDGTLIPTGNIVSNPPGTANDFWSKPKDIGEGFKQQGIKGNCGAGCDGFDNCYLVQREQYGAGYFSPLSDGGAWWTDDPVASLRSEWSGIQLNVYSDQAAFQMYSCNGQNGTMPIKKTQGFFNDPARPRFVPKYGCLVLEVQDWIDGINNPAWLRDARQIVGPKIPPYELEALYSFSVKPKA